MPINITFIKTKIIDVLQRRGILKCVYIRKQSNGLCIIPDEYITKFTKFGAFIDQTYTKFDNWRRDRHAEKYSCVIIYNRSLKRDLKKIGIRVKRKIYRGYREYMWIKKKEDAITFKLLFHDIVMKCNDNIDYQFDNLHRKDFRKGPY